MEEASGWEREKGGKGGRVRGWREKDCRNERGKEIEEEKDRGW